MSASFSNRARLPRLCVRGGRPPCDDESCSGGGRSSNGVEGRAGAGRGTRVESGVGGNGQVAGLAEVGSEAVVSESIL